MLAVADGVGGWANHGIDPGLYSKKLCKLMGGDITVKSEERKGSIFTICVYVDSMVSAVES